MMNATAAAAANDDDDENAIRPYYSLWILFSTNFTYVVIYVQREMKPLSFSSELWEPGNIKLKD